MGLSESWQNVEAHVKGDFESLKARIEQDLPVVGKAVQEAASNPVVAALSAAVHLPEAPEVLAMIADQIAKIDAALGAAKAAGAAAVQAPAEAPAPDVPVQSPAA